MSNIKILCEGKTEVAFCKTVLSRHLSCRGIYINPVDLGGTRRWEAQGPNELMKLTRDRFDYCAVLVDYYGLHNCWPGKADASKQPKADRGKFVECKLRHHFGPEVAKRFFPCVQYHEFETLFFASPEITIKNLGSRSTDYERQKLMGRIKDVLQMHDGNIELINDGFHTTPARRLKAIFSGYDKNRGITTLAKIPLADLRAGCPWLDRWVTTLEQLPGRQS